MTEWITSRTSTYLLFGWQGVDIDRRCFVFSLSSCNHRPVSVPCFAHAPKKHAWRGRPGEPGAADRHRDTCALSSSAVYCHSVCDYGATAFTADWNSGSFFFFFLLFLWNSYFRASLPTQVPALQIGSVFDQHKKIKDLMPHRFTLLSHS